MILVLGKSALSVPDTRFSRVSGSTLVGMHDIIGLISESADNGYKCKYRQGPDMKNYANMWLILETKFCLNDD